MAMQKKLAALNEGDSCDFYLNDEPKCPHCGDVYSIQDNDDWRLYSEGEHEITCNGCDLEFMCSTHVKHTFSTDEQEQD